MVTPLSDLSLEQLLALRESLTSNQGLGGLQQQESTKDILAEIEQDRLASGSALTRGLSRGVDVLQTGFGSALEGAGRVSGIGALERLGADVVAEQDKELAAKAPFATRLQDVKDAEGILGTTGALGSFTASALGESLPQMATTLGGSLAGAAAGARAGLIFGAPGAVVGGIAGGLLANVPFFYGMNREAQKDAIEQGERIEMNEGAALIASLPQSALDLVQDRLLVGLGPLARVDAARITREGGLFTRGVKGAALGAVTEVPTEFGQQVIERFQAGLPIDSPEAIDEYIEVMVAAGLVGGSIRGATNVLGGDVKKADAKKEQARKDAAKQAAENAEKEKINKELKLQQEVDDARQKELEQIAKGGEQLSLDVTTEQATPVAIQVKRLRSSLEQFEDGSYKDPTAGLKPEFVAEKDSLTDKIFDLKTNPPSEADAETIEAEIEVKEQRIKDINTEIDNFVKENKKAINQQRKDNRKALDDLKTNIEAEELAGTQDDLFVQPVRKDTTTLALLKQPLKDQPPRQDFDNEAGAKANELLDSGEFTLEDFTEPKYPNTLGKIKNTGLTLKQVEKIEADISNDRKSEIALENLKIRTPELLGKGFDKHNETVENLQKAYNDPNRTRASIFRDINTYRNKVEKRENELLTTQGEAAAQRVREELFQTQGFLFNPKSKTADKQSAGKLAQDLKISKDDILNSNFNENIDLGNIGVKDVRTISSKKTAFERKLAKQAAKQKKIKEAAVKPEVKTTTTIKPKTTAKTTAKPKTKAKTTAKPKGQEKKEAQRRAVKENLKETEDVKSNFDQKKSNQNLKEPENTQSFEDVGQDRSTYELLFTSEKVKNFAFNTLTPEDFKNIKPVGKGNKYTKSQVEDLIQAKEYLNTIKNLNDTKNLAFLSSMDEGDILKFNKESKANEAGNYRALEKFKGGKEKAKKLLENEIYDSISKSDAEKLRSNVKNKPDKNPFTGLESSSFGTPFESQKSTKTENKNKEIEIDEIKVAFPFTGGKYAEKYIDTLTTSERLELAGNILTNYDNSQAADAVISGETRTRTAMTKNMLEIINVETELESLEQQGKDNTSEYKKLENKRERLLDEKIEFENIGLNKLEKEANKLQTVLNTLITNNIELIGKIEATKKLKEDFNVEKNEEKVKLPKDQNEINNKLNKALKNYTSFVEKNYGELSQRHINAYDQLTGRNQNEISRNERSIKSLEESLEEAKLPSEIRETEEAIANLKSRNEGLAQADKRSLEIENLKSYLEVLSASFNTSPLETIADASRATTASKAAFNYSIPLENKTNPKTTVDKTKAAILEKFGQAGVNAVTVTTTPEKAGLTNVEPTAAGVVIKGKPYLFTDNIAEGNELGVLIHELGVHVGMPTLVGLGNYNFLIKKIKQFAAANDGSRESHLAKLAVERIKKAKKLVDINEDNELIAYFVEEAVNSGVDPTAERSNKTKLGIWFRRFTAGIKNILNKVFGLKYKSFDAQEFVDIAYGGADFAIRNPDAKFINSEIAIQYSVPYPIGGVQKKLNNTFRTMQQSAPQWSQPTIDNLLNNLSLLPDYLKKVWYNALSLRQLADTVDRFGPEFRPIADSIRKLNDIVNRRRFNIDQDRLNWQNILLEAQEQRKGYTDKDIDEFNVIVHESTLEEIDLRDTKNPDVTSTDLYKRYRRLVDRSSDLSKYDLSKSYKLMADAYEKAGERLLGFYTDVTGNEVLTDKQKQALGFMKGKITPYFPLVREGSWWIDYTDRGDGKEYTVAYETKREAELAAEEFSKDPEIDLEKRHGSFVYQRVRGDDLADGSNSVKILNDVQKAIEDRLLPGTQRDAAVQQIRDSILALYPSESLKQQFKRRKGTPGFRQDAFRNFASMGLKFSNELAVLDGINELNDVMGSLEKFSEGGKVPPVIANVLQSIGRREGFLKNPTPGALSSKLSYAGYSFFILGNISSALINLTQIPLVTYGLLAGEFGHARAVAEITKGFKAYFKFHKDDNTRLTAFGMPLADRTAFGGDFMTPEMKRLFDRALANGIIRRTTNQELQEAKFNRVDPVTGNMVRAEMALGYVFQNSERANREISLIAAYKLAKEKYGNEEVATKRAFELVEQANGPALAEAGPQFFQTGPGKVIGTFKRFALSQLYLQIKLARDIIGPLKDDPKIPKDIQGNVPSARTLAKRQLASIIVPAFLFAGVKGLPFYGLAEVATNLIDFLIPGDDEDELGLNFNAKVRSVLGDTIHRGPLSHFLNIDFSSRTGFYGLLYRDDPYRRADVGDLQYFVESLAGPAVAVFITNPTRAIEKYQNGDLIGAIQTASPSFIRNIIKAGKLATEGAVNSKGVPIVEDVNGYNVLMQFFGFTPTDLSNAYQANEILSTQQRKINSRRSSLLLELNMAKNAGDFDGETEILKRIDEFNNTDIVRDTGSEIKRSTKAVSYKNFMNYVKDQVRGLRITKEMREGLNKQAGIEDPEDL